MYNVSLLPAEYRLKYQSDKKKDTSLLIALTAMSLLLVVYFALTFVCSIKSRELNQLKSQNNLITKEITELTPLSYLYKEAQSIIGIVEGAVGTNPDWDDLIPLICNSVPETMALNNIDMSYSKTQGQCSIEGSAADHKTVSDWIIKLKQTSKTGEIKCSYSEVSTDASLPVQFEISFSLLAGDGYKLPMGVEINE